MLTALFIEFKETLEAPRNPRIRKINPRAISIIEPAALFSGAWKCARSLPVCTRSQMRSSLPLAHLSASLRSILGWGAQALVRLSLGFMRSILVSGCGIPKVSFMLQFPKLSHFLQKKTYKNTKRK